MTSGARCANEEKPRSPSSTSPARSWGWSRATPDIPILAKDIYDTKDMPTTGGSLVFDGYRPSDLYPDALPCLRALKGAGYRVGIAGNQPAAVEAFLREVDAPVDVVASSASWGVEKPSPAFFARVVAEVASVGNKGAAQLRLGALDRGRIAATRLRDSSAQTANVVPPRIEAVSLRARKQLDQLVRGRAGIGREPQRRAAP